MNVQYSFSGLLWDNETVSELGIGEKKETMSEQVESSPGEILPAKSEDKLEIEKEESAGETKEEEKAEEKGEGEEQKEGEREANKEGEEKKDESKEDGKEDEIKEEKKKFKMPNVNLKTPKVPGFLRSKSKERKSKVSICQLLRFSPYLGVSISLDMKILTAPSGGQNLNTMTPFKLHLQGKKFWAGLKIFYS